ncbi:hypothetical protein QUF74_18240 [Candidatus Halobeggiatoa sp. HSG11]|nr:hypothetical protein [Candidatus Halobeggiatoa sp. HSG11]
MIFKTGLDNYFYNENEQYGTGVEEFDNIRMYCNFVASSAEACRMQNKIA